MSEIYVTESVTTVEVTTPTSATITVTGATQAEIYQNQATLTSDLVGVNTIQSPAWIQFNTTAVSTGAVGRMHWNDTDGTLDLGLKGGNVTLQIGQEQVTLVKHRNNSGLTEGKVVYFYGSDGGNKTVEYAKANAEIGSFATIGVMTESVTGGQKGFCTTFGLVRNINTAHLQEGQIIWLSPTTAGEMTTTKPLAPDHLVQIGFCIRQSATVGSIFVSVQNGYELDELHNVRITNPQNGDILKYDSALGIWKNGQP